MNKKEVAKILNVSEKTIERYKSAGKLPAKLKRVVGGDGKARRVLDFNESDVEELKRHLSTDILFPTVTDGHAQTKTSIDTDRQTDFDTSNLDNTQLSTLGQTATGNIIDAISGRFESVLEKNLATVRVGGKILLSVKECALLTGLSGDYLRAAIKAGKLKAKIIGRGWKVKRQDLDIFIKKL
jgi:excisionase family DNA binding protein